MKRVIHHIIFSFLLVTVAFTGKAQQVELDTLKVSAYITPEGDTVGQSWLLPVTVLGKMSAAQRRAYAEWTRLRNAVYVTYPYAKAAGR
ncbi:MAG: DUF4294 domain-containing protein, partial [Chitinophagaceae bacterium]|nr:DUF4294 domain-containing protein [Chitinophagaceae bacterium]